MSPYNLRSNNLFKSRSVNSVCHGTESVSHLGPKIWDLAPNEMKLNLSMLSNSNQEMGPCTIIVRWSLSMQNMKNISWASGVKKTVFLVN